MVCGGFVLCYDSEACQTRAVCGSEGKPDDVPGEGGEVWCMLWCTMRRSSRADDVRLKVEAGMPAPRLYFSHIAFLPPFAGSDRLSLPQK